MYHPSQMISDLCMRLWQLAQTVTRLFGLFVDLESHLGMM